jgi:hypothetical protein
MLFIAGTGLLSSGSLGEPPDPAIRVANRSASGSSPVLKKKAPKP